jgi:hypothetical protein
MIRKGRTMQYAFLIYANPEVYAAMTQEERSALLQEYQAFAQEVRESGIMRGGSQLQPTSTATTLRIRNAEKLITDGPFAETKEQLAGYFVLQCTDLDEALALAERMPDVKHGSIEIRPVVER